MSNDLPRVRIPTTRRPAANALTRVMRPIISPVVTVSHRRCRSIRPGSPATSTTRKTTMNAGYIQCGETRKSPGSSWCRPTATRAATDIGHRRSPAVAHRRETGPPRAAGRDPPGHVPSGDPPVSVSTSGRAWYRGSATSAWDTSRSSSRRLLAHQDGDEVADAGTVVRRPEALDAPPRRGRRGARGRPAHMSRSTSRMRRSSSARATPGMSTMLGPRHCAVITHAG